MTIKKRLFLSNILMIIIPAFLSVLALAAGLFLFFVTAFPHAEYRLGAGFPAKIGNGVPFGPACGGKPADHSDF